MIAIVSIKNPYNYATTNLTRKFGIPVERAGIDLDGI